MPQFKLLVGQHSEGGRLYQPGEIVDSKSDLSKLNSPGAIKFERIVEDGEKAKKSAKQTRLDEEAEEKAAWQAEKAERRRKAAEASVPDVPQFQSVAPGGQVTTGKQQTTSSPTGEMVAGPVPVEEAARAKGSAGAGESDDGLEEMTKEELFACCEDEEIEVHKSARKDELVKAIREARQGG